MYRPVGMVALGQMCPEGTVGMPPYCYPTGGQPADPSAACPEGQCGWPPYCYPCDPSAPMPGGTMPGEPVPTGPAPEPAPPALPDSGGCPEGQIGYPPFCVNVPGGAPSAPSAPSTPTPTTPPGGVTDEPNWWEQRSDNEKAIIVGAGVLGVGALIYVAMKKKPGRAIPNRRRKRRKTRGRSKKAGSRARKGVARHNPKPSRQDVPYCHGSPPAKYRRLGATKPEHYALPECFKYPIHFDDPDKTRQHVAVATSRCVQFCNDYPKSVRDRIARNIDKARVQQGWPPHEWPWKKEASRPGQILKLLPPTKRKKAQRKLKMAAN